MIFPFYKEWSFYTSANSQSSWLSLCSLNAKFITSTWTCLVIYQETLGKEETETFSHSKLVDGNKKLYRAW